MPRTNEGRKKLAQELKLRQRNRSIQRQLEGGLSSLQRVAQHLADPILALAHGSLFQAELPTDTLIDALAQSEIRMMGYANSSDNHKNRKRVRWLGRWIKRINDELERRKALSK